MRYTLCACALTTFVGVAAGQQPTRVASTVPPSPITVVVPECRTPSSSTTASPADTLCVSRPAAIARAVRVNPQLQIAGAQAQQARARKVQGVALPDPTFSAEWDNSPYPFGIGGLTGKVVGASITVPFFDKFRLNGKIGTAGIHQSEADSTVVQQTIAAVTSETYDSLLSALRHQANLREADSLARDFAAKTRIRFDAGTVAKLDVVNADVAIGQVGNDIISNERDIANGRASLNRLMGRALGAPVAVADSFIIPPDLPDLAALLASGLARRSELASLQHQQAGARATTALAKEFWYPDLSIGIAKDYLADPTPGYLTTSISFPIPLLYWNHSKGEIAEDRYREQELDATLRDAQAAVGQDIRSAYATASAARRQAVYIRDLLLPAAREAYAIASASYGLGGLSALEVNSARSALLAAESQYTDALAAASSAWADLERAVAAPLTSFAPGASQ